MIKPLAALLLCLCAFDAPAYSQALDTYHVFPIVLDGSFPDGTFYRSSLFAVNTGSVNATCAYRSYGIDEDRLQVTNVFAIAGHGGVARASTAGNLQLATGYGTLSCDQSVQAYMQYEYVSAASNVLGIATVFSAPAASSAEFVFPLAPGYRLGLALANDSDVTATLNIRVGAVNNSELRTTLEIPPHTKISQFVDEIIRVPPGFIPVAVLVESIGSAQGAPLTRFHATGLIFWNDSFATVPPVVFHD